MAPSLELTSLPDVEESRSLKKTGVVVEVLPIQENGISYVPSTPTSYPQPASSPIQDSRPIFQIEEHPIDKVPELRVSLLQTFQ